MTKNQQHEIQGTFRKEQRRLYDFIRKRIANEEDAEDIVQDVFYDFIELYQLFQPVEQAAAWLFRAARNKIIDFYRKKKPQSLEKMLGNSEEDEGNYYLLDAIMPYSEEGADAEMMQEAIMEAVMLALEEIPQEQAEVFIAHEIDDKSFKEISEETGISVNTLLSRKRYAILALREKLKGLYQAFINN